MNNGRDSPDVSPPGIVNILPMEQPQQPYDEDDHSGEIREYNGVFEGPEKTLGEFVSWWIGVATLCISCVFSVS